MLTRSEAPEFLEAIWSPRATNSKYRGAGQSGFANTLWPWTNIRYSSNRGSNKNSALVLLLSTIDMKDAGEAATALGIAATSEAGLACA